MTRAPYSSHMIHARITCISHVILRPACDTQLTPVGQFEWEGAVEVVFDNRSGRVCSEAWDLEEAHVVCRRLGYVGALGATAITFTSSDLIWLSQLECNGSEESLCECAPFGDDSRNITAVGCGFGFYDAGVVCQSESCVYKSHVTIM